MRNQRNRKRCRGFSLLEIMVALMLFVVAVSAIMPLFAVGAVAHRHGMEQTEQSLLAQRIIARLKTGLDSREPGDLKDQSITDAGILFRYDVTFLPLDELNDLNPGFIVRITFKRPDGTANLEDAFETILLRKPDR